MLGSWVDVSGTKKILDVGTGCGIVALMLAQRSNAIIDAIDIDKNSVDEATMNFKNSPWPDRLYAFHIALQNYTNHSAPKYDLIVSNPPFFQNSLLPKKENLQLAKHNTTLNYPEFIGASVSRLTNKGRLAVILPVNVSDDFVKLANSFELKLQKQLIVFPTSHKPAKRVIHVFGFSTSKTMKLNTIVIRDSNSKYTEKYRQLTKAFHPEFA